MKDRSPDALTGANHRPGISAGAIVLLAIVASAGKLDAQQIVTDGRTQTALAQAGNVTGVTTTTISGSTAFNSFARFGVEAGNVVNLHLPDAAHNLINIVTGQRSDINGALNSIHNGAIGGSVYFVNPHGLVVGSQGVINAGAFSVSTPPHAFAQNFFDTSHNPNPTSVTALIEARQETNADALIDVGGHLNAIADISLSAGTISHRGTIQSGAAFTHAMADFSDVVNVTGYMKSGDISLIATRDIVLGGVVATDPPGADNGGTLSIVAGRNLQISPDTRLQAGAFAIEADPAFIVDTAPMGNGDPLSCDAPGGSGTITLGRLDSALHRTCVFELDPGALISLPPPAPLLLAASADHRVDTGIIFTARANELNRLRDQEIFDAARRRYEMHREAGSAVSTLRVTTLGDSPAFSIAEDGGVMIESQEEAAPAVGIDD